MSLYCFILRQSVTVLILEQPPRHAGFAANLYDRARRQFLSRATFGKNFRMPNRTKTIPRRPRVAWRSTRRVCVLKR